MHHLRGIKASQKILGQVEDGTWKKPASVFVEKRFTVTRVERRVLDNVGHFFISRYQGPRYYQGKRFLGQEQLVLQVTPSSAYGGVCELLFEVVIGEDGQQ